MPIVIPGNDFVPLDKYPPSDIDFKAKRLVHAKLMIHRGLRKRLGFSVKITQLASLPDNTQTGIPESDVKAHARRIADANGRFVSTRAWSPFKTFSPPPVAPSPYDIPVEKQSWVIIELDPWLSNWQFGYDYVGITTKVAAPGDNFGLHHVYASGSGIPGDLADGAVKQDKCKVAYFGVARRKKDESQFFNLHTEFLQPAQAPSTEPHRMIVIFDPDVGNNGGFPIPP